MLFAKVLRFIGGIAISTVVGLLFAFTLVNFLLGCDNWANHGSCLSPTQVYRSMTNG